ncbi:MAG: hypothetical protein IJ228_03670 [Succinivibrio sp.]|nr:hypothetical protein [Succinivibrio sp.]
MCDIWQQDLDRAKTQGKTQLMHALSQLLKKIRQAGKDTQDFDLALEQKDLEKLNALCRQYGVEPSPLE